MCYSLEEVGNTDKIVLDSLNLKCNGREGRRGKGWGVERGKVREREK